MKKRNQSSILSLLIVAAVLFGMALKCGGSAESRDGFPDGHKLDGRYINTNQGIQSFTFSTDGTFQKSGASSGSIPGGNGDYVSGSTISGTYHLDDHTLTLKYEDGKKEEREIEIFNCCKQPDYSQQTPAQIKLNHVLFTNVED